MKEFVNDALIIENVSELQEALQSLVDNLKNLATINKENKESFISNEFEPEKIIPLKEHYKRWQLQTTEQNDKFTFELRTFNNGVLTKEIELPGGLRIYNINEDLEQGYF